jgi:hypothetical protein
MTREIDRMILEKCRQVTVEKNNDRLMVFIEDLTKLFEQRDLILEAGENSLADREQPPEIKKAGDREDLLP